MNWPIPIDNSIKLQEKYKQTKEEEENKAPKAFQLLNLAGKRK